MTEWANLFRGKKITVMGLGLLGRGVGDVKFLAECDADLIVTDLKSEKELAPSLKKLSAQGRPASGGKPITYIFGRHRLQDFRGRDFILKAAGVPLGSPYLTEAKKYGVPVYMSTALFVQFARERGVTIVGVTGTRGKSTTVHLLHRILSLWISEIRRSRNVVWLGGNVRGVSTLALLPKVRPGDIAVLELDSWQLQGFGEAKISPHIAVFTNFLSDHLNYYRGDTKRYFVDKTNIFKWQRPGDHLILGGKNLVPKSWRVKIPGAHNLKNISCAIQAAEILGVPKTVIKKAVENFTGVPGRLELVRVWRGIKIYNDTTATTPDATIAALRAVGRLKKKSASRRIILLTGGADKNLALADLIKLIPKYCKTLILLPGTGTEKLKAKSYKLKALNPIETATLREAVRRATETARRGDVILFSPAFASFGLFKNEYDRGDQFSRLVKKPK